MRGEFFGRLDARGRKTSRGRYNYPNRCFAYEGDFVADAKHGSGRLLLAGGGGYAGEFRDGEITGAGELTLATGLHYKGGFLRGERHGAGELSTSRVHYKGGFALGRFEGPGELLRREENRLYRGVFAAGEMQGEFEIVAADTRELLFRGQLCAGRRAGRGTLFCGRWRLTALFDGEQHEETVVLELADSAFVYRGLFAEKRPRDVANCLSAELLTATGQKLGKPAARQRIEYSEMYRLSLSCLWQAAAPEPDAAEKKRQGKGAETAVAALVVEAESGRLFIGCLIDEAGERHPLAEAGGEPLRLSTQAGIASSEQFCVEDTLPPGLYTLLIEEAEVLPGEWFEALPSFSLAVELVTAVKVPKR